MTKTSLLYQSALRAIPAPGNGCHPHLLRVSNYGVMAGVDDQAILQDIRTAIPAGKRRVPDREIRDAITRARLDHKDVQSRPRSQSPRHPPSPAASPIFDGQAALRALVQKGGGEVDEMEILDSSDPTRIPIVWPQEEDSIHLLKALYEPNDHLYVGSRYGKGPRSVRRVAEWVDFLECHTRQGTEGLVRMAECTPLIAPNPMTGEPAMSKAGHETWRGDACVKTYRFVVCEFDDLPKAQQLAFWRGVGLPICALIDSGNKSLHAWVKVDGIANAQQWQQQIGTCLYRNVLEKLGLDPACKNPSRLSRLPGVPRLENGHPTGNWQHLVYLNPHGGCRI